MTSINENPAVAAVPSVGQSVSPDVLIGPNKFRYEVVQGFFIQNGPNSRFKSFAQILTQSFGLIDTSPERWENLKRSIEQLQQEAAPDVQYKVFFLGRHGEGLHNHAETHYGSPAWNAKWARLSSDGTLTWGPDPPLSDLGFTQADAVCKALQEQVPLGAPITGEEMRWFVSPMARAVQTFLHSWAGLSTTRPRIWEDFREVYGRHTCDIRSTKSVIAERFPEFDFEDGFTEADELWKPDERETEEHMQIRAQRAMDRMFGEGGVKETYISITGHSGIFTNLLAVLGHQVYPFETGELIPVVVRATKL